VRFLIFSDVHGNWEALEAVLRRTRRKRFDAVLVLGDLVGYGAAPNLVVAAIRELALPVYLVRGNHDKAVAGLADASHFNASAQAAAKWTTQHLEAGHLRFLRELPRGPIVVGDGIVCCHGSPLDEDQYLFSAIDAWEIFARESAALTFFGHTHLPSLFVQGPRGLQVTLLKGASGSIVMQPEHRYLINPGAIGQPRDRDPRAAYMTYDSERRTVHWHRLEYPVERAQRRILDAGLPRSLADRLAVGV